jgi:hypothetical protein
VDIAIKTIHNGRYQKWKQRKTPLTPGGGACP